MKHWPYSMVLYRRWHWMMGHAVTRRARLRFPWGVKMGVRTRSVRLRRNVVTRPCHEGASEWVAYCYKGWISRRHTIMGGYNDRECQNGGVRLQAVGTEPVGSLTTASSSWTVKVSVIFCSLSFVIWFACSVCFGGLGRGHLCLIWGDMFSLVCFVPLLKCDQPPKLGTFRLHGNR